MTTENNRNVSLSHRTYGTSRTIRKVSPPSGKDEDSKKKGFFNRPLPGGKTPWDWLQLVGVLLIPLVIFLATWSFNQQQADLAQQQHQADQQSALDQQRAAILQTYIDNIQDLLLNHNLLKSKSTDDVVILARARTLTALQDLDPVRKGRLVQFLYEAKLIGFLNPETDATKGIRKPSIIRLSSANLSSAILYIKFSDFNGADFNGANLSKANLFNTSLSKANLSRADLSNAVLTNAFFFGALITYANLISANLVRADLEGAFLDRSNLSGANLTSAFLVSAHLASADLKRANLISANLISANLSNADLKDANLSDTILYHADITDARNLTQQQLDQVYTCKGAILPQGLTCHHNQTPPWLLNN